MRRLLCWLGRHAWGAEQRFRYPDGSFDFYVECRRCPKVEVR